MADKSGTSTSPLLEDTVRQLWGRARESGLYRITAQGVGPPDPGWSDLRRFTVVRMGSRPSLLLERGDRRAVARSLLAYRRLRSRKPQLGRLALASTSRMGLPVPAQTLVLQQLRGSAPDSLEVLGAIARTLDAPVLAHIGVRTGANAKPTAQLFSPVDGSPVGYAKVAWNRLTSDYVLTEARRLRALNGSSGHLRTPRVQAVGHTFEMPFVILAPLPVDVSRLTRISDLTEQDFRSISPVIRRGSPRTSGQLKRLVERMETRKDDPVLRRAGPAVLDLAARLFSLPVQLPIMAYDHGDLVPWNASRARSGELWVWDWESSEDDTVAGADAVHWFVHAVHGHAPKDLASAIVDAAGRAVPAHRALGMGGAESRAASAAYALVSAERACSLAHQHQTWERNRVKEEDVLQIVRCGIALLGRP